tara:strand:+ start:3671 stop:4906 length:1236 start_codon:yes stop_codon:yes gene_type:complete
MAENIVAGLFGLTPQMYQNQQYGQDLNRGIALAQLSPGAAAQAGLQASVGQLGRGIAGAMGIEDPQLKLISARNSIAQQIDQTDPESILKGAQMLAQMGDQQGAMALAQYARQAQESVAQTKQRLAAAMASEAASKRERVQSDPEKVRLAKSVAELSGPEGSIEYNTAYAKSLREQVEPKAEKDLRFGVDREAIAGEMFDNKSFSQLTATEKAAVNKRVETEKPRTTITNVMPGDKQLADIPAFRASVQRTIEPQSKAVFAADNALVNIEDSINTDNFTSFRAAKTQFARAISGSGDLSQKELLAAGADPALIGGTADYLAELFTSTPTLDTQNKMKKTLLAIKKVSTDKAKAEIEAQRKIAYSNPGYDKARVDQALAFPEFSGQNIAIPDTGDYAAQARAELEKRKKVTK